MERLARVRGREQYRIEYRHLMDWLVRKPRAFAQYRYREALFPASRFRMAYDALHAAQPRTADREYLTLLHLAAHGTEQGVDDALRLLLAGSAPSQVAQVAALVRSGQQLPPATAVKVLRVDL